MRSTGAFRNDLQVGKEYENEVVEIFELIFGVKMRKVSKETDPDLYLYLDIIEDDDKKPFPQLISAECKYSGETHNDSPNVVIEYQTYGDEPSGITTSLAKFWVFKTGRFHLIVRRDELVRTIIYDLSHKETHRRIKIKKFDKKSILLVPIDLLLDRGLCPSTQRQLTKQAILEKIADEKIGESVAASDGSDVF